MVHAFGPGTFPRPWLFTFKTKNPKPPKKIKIKIIKQFEEQV